MEREKMEHVTRKETGRRMSGEGKIGKQARRGDREGEEGEGQAIDTKKREE